MRRSRSSTRYAPVFPDPTLGRSCRAPLHGDLGIFLRLRLHRLGIAALDRRPGGGDGGFDLRLEASVHLVAMLTKLLLGGVDQAFGIVLRLCRLATLLVLLGDTFGILAPLVSFGVLHPDTVRKSLL